MIAASNQKGDAMKKAINHIMNVLTYGFIVGLIVFCIYG